MGLNGSERRMASSVRMGRMVVSSASRMQASTRFWLKKASPAHPPVWHVNAFRGPLFFRPGDTQIAAMQHHDLPANGQPEAETPLAAAAIFGGEIRTENMGQILTADAGAVDDDLHPIPIAAGLGLGHGRQLH